VPSNENAYDPKVKDCLYTKREKQWAELNNHCERWSDKTTCRDITLPDKGLKLFGKQRVSGRLQLYSLAH
jgi:hypothetical protein